jgi:3-methyl-2-oxobutanoate hydroxymethyltransferase
MPDMLHHTRAVARGVKRALLVADIPFRALSLANARRLVKAGAEAVKVEGTKGIKVIRQIISAGIPVMGHLGYLPQTDKKPKLKKSRAIVNQAKELEKAGAFAIVLEMVAAEIAKEVTRAVGIPTIGIGSGKDCGGQVLVTYDLLGLYENPPSFVKKYADLDKTIRSAVRNYLLDTRGNRG